MLNKNASFKNIVQHQNQEALNELFQKGIAFHHRGQIEKAKIIYEKIIKIHPSHSDALHLLGLIAYQNKNLILAKDLIDKAINYNPHFPVALNNRGNILRDLNRLEDAIQSYDNAIALKPDYAQAYNNRGNALRDMKKLDEAIQSYEKAIAINPNNADAYFNQGNSLQGLNRFEDAIKCYDKVISLNPKDAEAFNYKGIALLNVMSHSEALECFDKCLALVPTYAPAHLNRGRLLRKLKRPEEAAVSFEACIRLEPNNHKYLLLGGLNYSQLKNISAAERLLNLCVTLNPTNHEQIKTRAVAYLILNKWEKAFDTCLEVLPSAPSEMHDTFDNPDSARSYISSLPKLHFIKANEWMSRRTIMFAADEIYIKNYFMKALASIEQSNPNINVHLHAMLTSDASAIELCSIAKDNVSFSYELYSPENKTGYTTRRFVRIHQLLHLLKQPILCLDIDSCIINELAPLFDNLSGADIALYRRNAEPVINQLIAAGMFWACPNPGAFRFIYFFINYIQYLESKHRLTWFADQMALLAADEWVIRHPDSVVVDHIPEETLSWSTPNHETLVQTFKGDLKSFNI